MTQRAGGAVRRGVLKSGVAALGVVLGAALTRGQATAAVPAPGGSFRLYGRNWYGESAHLRAGEAPGGGDRLSVYGELLDAPDGHKVGEFYSSVVCLASPYRESAFGAAALEVHTLNLEAGTIVGIGSGSGGERTYAIVGGTGRYTGARGSYRARQDPYGFGGDGSAEFVVTLA